MRATFEREFQEYFNTMLGYVFVSAFLFLAGVFFSVNNINELSAEFNTTLNDCIYVFLLTSPLLTMKLLSEEKKIKRDQLLMTTKTSLSFVIVGKFLAALSVFCCYTVFHSDISNNLIDLWNHISTTYCQWLRRLFLPWHGIYCSRNVCIFNNRKSVDGSDLYLRHFVVPTLSGSDHLKNTCGNCNFISSVVFTV